MKLINAHLIDGSGANPIEGATLILDERVKEIASDGSLNNYPDSEILEVSKQSYKRLFNKDAKVLAVHAGLECGLIGETYPGMDMISYGPDLKGVHSPDERIEIKSVEKFWDLTLEILKNIPKQKVG